jgi:hypothetical protein
VNGEVDECLRTIGSLGPAAAPSSQLAPRCVQACEQAVVSSSEVVKVRLWSG